MLTIAGGIILAFFILGLLEDIPETVWYWVFGGLVVWAIYEFWPTFWSDIFTFILIVVCIAALSFVSSYLQTKISKWLHNRKGK